MGKCAKSKACRIFHADGGKQVVDHMSREQAEIFAERGALDREYDKVTGQQLGYRVAGGARDKVDGELRTVFQPAAIDAHQMERNAEFGRGRSLRSLEKAASAIPEESLGARRRAKVLVYPHVGPKRGAILAAWPL